MVIGIGGDPGGVMMSEHPRISPRVSSIL